MTQTQIKKIHEKIGRLPIPSSLKKLGFYTGVIVGDVLRSDLLKQSSAMAYVTLLSIIPSLVAIFCVFSLFTPLFLGQTDPIQMVKSYILSNLAAGSGSTAVTYLDEMLSKLDLKTIGWSSFASVLVTLILLLKQIEVAINKIWFIKKPRNLFVRFMYFWSFLTLGMLGFAATFGLSAQEKLKNWIGTAPLSNTPHELGFLSWALSFSTTTLFFFLLYKIIPNCKVYKRPALIGSVIAAILLTEGAYLYGLFVRDSSNYKTLYGALAQLPVFLMWLYVCWTIILFGALISWRAQEKFPSFESVLNWETAPTAKGRYRNIKIREALPRLAFLEISKKFLSNNGQGLTCQKFADDYDIPLSWAQEAFELLAEHGFIHVTKPQKTGLSIIEASSSDHLEVFDPCVPAYPPDKFPLSRVHASLSLPLKLWIEDHGERCLPEARAFIVSGVSADELL